MTTLTLATATAVRSDRTPTAAFELRHGLARRCLAHALLIAIGALSAFQVMGFTLTLLTPICLLVAPAMLLVRPTLGQVLAPALAAVAFGSFVVSAQINHLSLLDQRVVQWASFGIYAVGFVALVGRDLARCGSLLCGIAIGTIGYMETAGPPYSSLSTLADLWKYEFGQWVTIIMVYLLAVARVRLTLQVFFLVALAGFSLLQNYRSHAIVCLAAAAVIFIGIVGEGRMARWLQLGVVVVIGYGVSFALPMIATSGIAGEAIKAKTELQQSSGVPALLAGRTESPLSVAAIADRPLLGWGSANNLSPEVFERAETIALWIGFDPSVPLSTTWFAETGDVSLHSVLLTSWAEGGLLAALMPIGLLVAALCIIWNASRYGRWSVLAVVLCTQAMWDLLFSPTSYNTLPTFAMLAVIFAARHFPAASTAPSNPGADAQIETARRSRA